MKEYIISGNDSGQRLDKFLGRKLSYAPKSFFYKMLRKKNITLNGKKASGNELLSDGDSVKLFLSDETFEKFRYGESGAPDSAKSREKNSSGTAQTPDRGRVSNLQEYKEAYKKLSKYIRRENIVFENEHVLIVNKPSGVLSQKASANDLSLNEWIAGYVMDTSKMPEHEMEIGFREFRPCICNRLDRNTSGLVICAKTLPGSRIMTDLIRNRSIGKFYQMAVHGRVKTAGKISTALSKDRRTNVVQARSEMKSGKDDSSRNALTLYKPVFTGDSFSVVEAELVTGRSHQLRVHMASKGWPIIGDPKYGDRRKDEELVRKKNLHLRGQMLCCAKLDFPKHMPAPLREMSGLKVSCDLPKEFTVLIGE